MLSYGQYQNIVKLATGEEKPGEILIAMKKWARQQYGITLMDTTFDSGYFGSSTLSVVVYDVQDYERTGFRPDTKVSAVRNSAALRTMPAAGCWTTPPRNSSPFRTFPIITRTWV